MEVLPKKRNIPCTTDWHWYPVEFDGKDLFFGLVIGFERELGYFSLAELESVKVLAGFGVMRDESFVPVPVSTIGETRS